VTLADTSVWVSHLRGTAQAVPLRGLLDKDLVVAHPWVMGELALGNLGRRSREVLNDLSSLPRAPVVGDHDLLGFIAVHSLAARGIGWVDVQLLAAALACGADLWTFDRRLAAAAAEVLPAKNAG